MDAWGFDWLEYPESDKASGVVSKVWCKYCRNFKNKSLNRGQAQLCDLDAFVQGTENIKKDTAKSHMNSKTHEAALAADAAEKEGLSGGVLGQLRQIQPREEDRISKLFDIAYTIAKCELPFTLFPTLIALEKRHGVDLGTAYANDKACKDFTHHIAGSMKDDMEKLFHEESNEEPFYCSLLFDGSTDKATSEKEVLCIKVLEDGVPTIKLLG